MKKFFFLPFFLCIMTMLGNTQPFNTAGTQGNAIDETKLPRVIPYDAVENSYELTASTRFQTGAVWNTQQIDLNCNFTITASLFFGNINENNNNEDPANLDDGGDGMAFVLQETDMGVGGEGGGLGVFGIIPSFIAEFDTYRNFIANTNDPIQDHIAFSKDGNEDHLLEPVPTAPLLLPNVENSAYHTVLLEWNASTKIFKVTFDNIFTHQIAIDLRADIFACNRYVYAGFTAATGFAINQQKVKDFTLTPGPCSMSLSSCDCGFVDGSGVYYGGFEGGTFGPNSGTDLKHGLPRNGSWEIVSDVDDLGGGGYLDIHPKTGDYFFAAHTSNKLDKRVLYSNVAVTPGKTYQFCASVTALKNLGKGEKFILSVCADGVAIGSGKVTESWTEICGTFVGPASGMVELAVCDKKKGQYFVAIDDLCLTEVPPRPIVGNQFPILVEQAQDLKIDVAPNPTRSYFQLKLENNNSDEKITIRVIDAFGRTVKQITNSQSNNVVSFGEDLKAGNYFAEVIQGNQRKVIKLIKQ